MMSHSNYLFVLESNPFPLLSSFSFFNVVISLFFFLKINCLFILFSLIFSLLTGFFWWFSYTYEMVECGLSSPHLETGLKFSFFLFICSEVFLFFSFFWSYFHYFLSPTFNLNHSWPPFTLGMFDFLDIPLLNTFLLLSSGVSVTASHSSLISGNLKYFFSFLILTYILGFVFSFFQYLEYSNSFFSCNDASFGSCFYTLTGFHGIHVLIGSMFLMYVSARILTGLYSEFDFVSFELSSWYWHFVDVVWAFLYFFVYVYSCS